MIRSTLESGIRSALTSSAVDTSKRTGEKPGDGALLAARARPAVIMPSDGSSPMVTGNVSASLKVAIPAGGNC